VTPSTTVAPPGTPAVPSGAAGAPARAGRIDISDRVLRRVAEKAAADTLGVDPKDVTIDIAAARDTVVIRIHAPYPVPRLDDTAAITAATPVLDAARHAQTHLHDHLTHLYGRDVSRVDITLTGATTPKRKRVR